MATRASATLVKVSLTDNGRSVQSLSKLCSRAYSLCASTARQPGILGVSSQNEQFVKTVKKKHVGQCLDQCRDQSTISSRRSLAKQLLSHCKVVHSLGAVRQYCAVAPVQNEEAISTEDDDEGSFDRVGLSEHVKAKLHSRGIHSLFPVQYKAYEQTKAGKDVIIQARTGTGKTLSFAIPLVEKLLQQKSEKKFTSKTPKVLVLTPTRELANQITEDFASLSTSIHVVPVYGGTSITRQYNALRQGCDVIVGTPGRVQDMITRQFMSLNDIEHVVLDEVDTMLDIGFKVAVEKIIAHCYSSTRKPQTMLYSATITDWVIKTAGKYLAQDYTYLNFVKGESTRTATTVQQYCCEVNERNVPTMIMNLANRFTGTDGRAIVFTERKRQVDWYCNSPVLRSISRGLHGDKTQLERESTLKGFKENRFQILICTSVAARGLDIPDVSLVIQTCPPNNTDDYIHRVGRTGRAGKNGVGVLFYDQTNASEMRNIERACQVRLQKLDLQANAVSQETIRKKLTIAYDKLDSVPEFLVEKYRAEAAEYATERGVGDAMASALVVMSGLQNLLCTSLLTQDQDAVTVQYSWTGGAKTTREVLQEVNTALGQSSAVIGPVKAVLDSKAVVFDVKPDMVSKLISAMKDAATGNQVEVLRQLPKVEGHVSFSGGSNSNSGYGDSNSRGGSWDGGFRSSRGGGDGGMRYDRNSGYVGRGGHGGDPGSFNSRYSSRGDSRGSFSRRNAGTDSWDTSDYGGYGRGGSQQRSGGSFNRQMAGADAWAEDDFGKEDYQQESGQSGNSGYNRYSKSRGRFGTGRGEFRDKRKGFGHESRERFGERDGEERFARDGSGGARGFARAPNFSKFEID